MIWVERLSAVDRQWKEVQQECLNWTRSYYCLACLRLLLHLLEVPLARRYQQKMLPIAASLLSLLPRLADHLVDSMQMARARSERVGKAAEMSGTNRQGA